jgi:hypothetical protein
MVTVAKILSRAQGLPHKQRLSPLITSLPLLRLKVYGDKDTAVNYFLPPSHNESFLAKKEPKADDNNKAHYGREKRGPK